MNIDAKNNNGWGYDQNFKYVSGVGNGDQNQETSGNFVDTMPAPSPAVDVSGETKKAVKSSYVVVGIGVVILIGVAVLIKKLKL